MLKALLAQVLPRAKKADAPAASLDATPLQQAQALVAAKDWEAAARLTEEILVSQPDEVEAILLLARSFRARGLLEQAQQAYRRALVLAPSRAEAWLDLGVCHHLAGDDFWARVYYRFANELDSGNGDIWNEMGVVDIALGNFEKAEEALENAVARKPGLPEAWNNLGLVLARRGELATARKHFLRATFLRPEYYTAHCNAGLAAKDLELLDEAERALRRAVEIDPAPYTAWLNLGAVLQDAGRLDPAQSALESALDRAPGNADVLAALSTLSLRRGDAAKAATIAMRALAVDAQHADARLALAHAQLAVGNYAEGWVNYEARLRSTGMTARHLTLPAWRGEPLRGKRLLVWGEQGLGDEIMFASCLPDLLASGAHCILDCSRRLRPLFKRSFAGVEFLDDAPAPVDGSLAIGSLPSLFRKRRETFPQHAGYLRADSGRQAFWGERLASLAAGRKVGLSWRGGLMRTGRALRSLEVEELLPVLRTPGVSWVNLQHGDSADALARLRNYGVQIASWGEALADLDETAALISGLDLVITVCSTVVHLAGALGRPTWVLTPRGPAWRYLLEGEQVPWYPSAVLYRQTTQGDWAGVVQRMAADLQS